MKATIYVTIKKNVLDVQGNAILLALHSMGFDEVEKFRMGKYLEIELAASDREQAEASLKKMCENLLANTIIEDYRFEIA